MRNLGIKYRDYRAPILEYFNDNQIIEESRKGSISPSGKFLLEYFRYKTGETTWDFSRGIVTRREDGQPVGDIKRNFGHFWHRWVEHSNGHEYLLCGEDYQGYSILNVDTGDYHVHFPDAGYNGGGFCWTGAFPSPQCDILAVEGCLWGASYDVVFLDFKEPENLPYPELSRIEDSAEISGWKDNDTFVLKTEIEVRKSDRKPYHELDEAEQELLDADDSLLEYACKEVDVNVRQQLA